MEFVKKLLGVGVSLLLIAMFSACNLEVSTVVEGDVISMADGRGNLACSPVIDSSVAAVLGGGYRRCIDGRWIPISEDEAFEEGHILGKLVYQEGENIDIKLIRLEDLPGCYSIWEGASVYIKSEDKYLECRDSEWILKSADEDGGDDDGYFEDGDDSDDDEVKSSSSQRRSSSSRYEIFTDARDGQQYKSIEIGGKIWMAENLNYAYNVPTESLDSSSFCYDNEIESCAKFGRLYIWSAAMDSAATISSAGEGCGYYGNTCGNVSRVRGVCPKGWHLPNKSEWRQLLKIVGDQDILDLESIDASDLKSNLSANPTGYYNSSSDRYYGNGTYTGFWSSTGDDNESDAYLLSIDYEEIGYVGLGYSNKSKAWPVRCIHN